MKTPLVFRILTLSAHVLFTATVVIVLYATIIAGVFLGETMLNEGHRKFLAAVAFVTGGMQLLFQYLWIRSLTSQGVESARAEILQGYRPYTLIGTITALVIAILLNFLD